MTEIQSLSGFLEVAANDPRIGGTHISLYAALLFCWHKSGYKNPFNVFSWEVRKYAKIGGNSTYHNNIKDLCAYGYINYIPSFNHSKGSKVFILTLSGESDKGTISFV